MSQTFGSIYIVNRYASLHKYLKEKEKEKKTLGMVEINVKML